MAASRKRTFDRIEIDETSNESESELETEFECLNLSSTDEDDEESNASAPNARTRSTSRKWRSSGFDPEDLEFDDRESGVCEDFELGGNKPSDYFKAFLNNELMQIIVEETNTYQRQQETPEIDKTAAWYDTNVAEMYTFFATTILMGLNRKNRIKDYWSTDKLMTTPIFGELFTRNRYLSILRYLHFADNSSEEEGKLRKIQPIVEHLREKFEKVLNPWENLCIHESLMLWKGRLSFKQYIPSKRRRFGVKLFILCECETKFVLNFIIYTGVDTEIDHHPEFGVSGSVVLTLMENYLGKNHTLFVDNWFSSPLLFERLLEGQIKACGTVRKNRNGMPLFGMVTKGQQGYRTIGELLALKWMDRREVHMLTTLHDPIMVETGKHDRETSRKS